MYQDDYALTRLVDPRIGNLNATVNDKVDATEIAHGFGIGQQDITVIHDLPILEMTNKMLNAMKPIRELAKNKKKSFLFVYAAGHGIADSVQFMLTNATSGNIYPLEDNLRGWCGQLDNYCTIFVVYDMCKSESSGYQKLTKKAVKP